LEGGGGKKIDAQEYVNSLYPNLEDKMSCQKLKIAGKHTQYKPEGLEVILEGRLSLQGFVNLKVLDCSLQQLTELDVEDCSKLKLLDCHSNRLIKIKLPNLSSLIMLNCSNNYLVEIDFLAFDSKQLINLSINDNNFPTQCLNVFSGFTNLRILEIGNLNKEKISQNVYNKFYGSLEPLKNFTKLNSLVIDNTDVDSGLEHLTDNVQEISCTFAARLESKVIKIAKQLNNDKLFILDKHDIKYKKI